MGIPAFAGGDKEDFVTGVIDNVAAVVKAQGKFLAGAEDFRKRDEEVIVAAE